MDETCVLVKGEWRYLYRAVDSTGATLDFLLSAKQDAAAAKRFQSKKRSTANSTVFFEPPMSVRSIEKIAGPPVSLTC
jgi:transposase-like protein